MIRNMPNNFSRQMLMDLLEAEGFAGQYDFLYLPMDFKSRACLGYAFINLVSPEVAIRLWNTFDGFSNWGIPSKKVSGVSWSHPTQGLQANIDRFRNSPVMSDKVPDEYRPILLSGTARVEFPAPTKKISGPNIVKRKNKAAKA
jgi:hypothetical protein